MKKEENVYEKMEGTEEKVVKQNGVENTADKEASTVPDKFKDVDALARAYTALQAEFTRRSQRLKELEKQLENSDADGDSGAEKLRKNARVRKVEKKRFEEFLAETEGRDLGVDSTAKEPNAGQPSGGVQAENSGTMYAMNAVPDTGNNVDKQTGMESQAAIDTLGGEKAADVFKSAQSQGTSVADSERAAMDSQTLYNQVCRDENVRLRIIGEYLSSLGKSDAPLMRGGMGIMTAPPKKANSISEAGDMALIYLKKPVEL